MADGIKVSQLTSTAIYTGGIIEISVPDGGGGWLSRSIGVADLFGDAMTKSIYDPGSIAENVFDSLYHDYDPVVSGLTATDVQNAIDELASIIDALSTGEANTGANVGGELEVFKEKSGIILNFRTIQAGSNMLITQEDDTITFHASLEGGGIIENAITVTIPTGGIDGTTVYPIGTSLETIITDLLANADGINRGSDVFVVADLTARDNFPSVSRKEGMIAILQSDFSWYQLQGGITNSDWVKIKAPTPENSNRTIYYSTTGDDDTGDGTVGTPFLTVLRCIQDISDEISEDVEITIQGTAGTYSFDWASILHELKTKNLQDGAIIYFEGVMTTITSGLTLTPQSPEAYIYDVTGATFTANEHQGRFIANGTTYDGIADNGTDTIRALPGNSGATAIVEPSIIWDISDGMIKISMDNPAQLSQRIEFNNIKITCSGQNFNFTNTNIRADVNNCIISSNKFTQGTNEHERANFTRCCFIGTTGGAQIAKDELQFDHVTIIKTGTQADYGINLNNDTIFRAQRSIYLYNFLVGFRLKGGTLPLTQSGQYTVIDNCATAFAIRNNSHVVSSESTMYLDTVTNLIGDDETLEGNYNVVIISMIGTPTNYLADTALNNGFVSPDRGIAIKIPDVFTEFEKIDFTIANNDNEVIELGDISQNYEIIVDYYINRNDKIERGVFYIECKSASIVTIEGTKYDDDSNPVGLTIANALNSNVIEGTFTLDDNVDSGDVRLIINRKMI